MAEPGEYTLAGIGAEPPSTSGRTGVVDWGMDQARSVYGGFVQAAADLMGLGEMATDSEWWERNRKALQSHAQSVMGDIRPDRRQAMEAEWIPSPGSGKPSAWDNPLAALQYQGLQALGSMVPTMATRMAGVLGGPAGLVATGVATEAGMAGGGTFTKIKDAIAEIPVDQMGPQVRQLYDEAVQAGLTDANARKYVTHEMSLYALTSGVVGGLLGGVGIKGGSALSTRLLGKNVDEAGGNLLQRGVAGGLPEGAQELGQQFGQTGSEALAMKDITGISPTWQSILNELAQAGILGTSVGGVAGGAFGRRTVVPGQAPDAAQTAALDAHKQQTPPPAAPPETTPVTPPAPPGPSPTVPGALAPAPPAGGVTPPVSAVPVEETGMSPPAGSPNVPAPGVEPGSELDAANQPPTITIPPEIAAKAHAAFQQQPETVKAELQRMFQEMLATNNPSAKQAIGFRMLDLMNRVGMVPADVLSLTGQAAAPAYTGAPSLPQPAGPPVTGGPGPGTVRTQAIPSVTPSPVSQPDVSTAREGRQLDQGTARQALTQALAGASQNQLAGTRVDENLAEIVDDIIAHALDEAKGQPLNIAALLSSMQSYMGYRGPATKTAVDTRPSLGEQVVGVDRAGRPVRIRDVVGAMAEQLYGGNVPVDVTPTVGRMATQSLRVGTAASGATAGPRVTAPSAKEAARVEKLAAHVAAGIARARKDFAQADDTARTSALDSLRAFVAAVHRAVAIRADADETGALVTAERRLGEAQDELSRLRDQMGERTREGAIGAVLRQVVATVRQIAPQSSAKLDDAFRARTGTLARVVKRMEELQNDTSNEIRGDAPDLPDAKPEGKPTFIGTIETPKGRVTREIAPKTGSDMRTPAQKVRDKVEMIRRRQKAQQDLAEQQPPAPPPKKDLPVPAAERVVAPKAAALKEKARAKAEPRPEIVVTDRPMGLTEEERQAKIAKVKALVGTSTVETMAARPAPTADQAKIETAENDRQVMTHLMTVDVGERGALVDAVLRGDGTALDLLREAGSPDPTRAAQLIEETLNAQANALAATQRKPQPAKPDAQPVQATVGRPRPPRPGSPEARPAQPLAQGGVGGADRQRRPAAARAGDQPARPAGTQQVAAVAGRRPGLVKLDSDILPAVPDASSAWAGKLDEGQSEGLNRMVAAFAAGLRAFALSDGTGVGKTRQEVAIAVEGKRRSGRPAVIITPANTVETFKRAMETMAIPAGDRPRVFTYDDLRTGKVPKQRYSVIVLDEGHSLKNAKSARTKAVEDLSGDMTVFASATMWDGPAAGAHTIAMLTGDPIGTVASRLGFTIAYTEKGEAKTTLKPGVTWADVNRNLGAWRDKMVSQGAGLRRHYPFHGSINTEVNINAPRYRDQERALDAYWNEQILMSESPAERRARSGDRVRELRAFSELSKLDETKARVTDALARGEKVIVVAESVNDMNFKAPGFGVQQGVMAQLSDWAQQQGIPTSRIYGPGNKRPEADKFQKGQTSLVLMTAKSGGTGIDLDDQAGNAPRRMLVLTAPYAGDTFEQLIGRVSRRDTVSPAQVDVLRHRDGIADDHGWSVLQKKIASLEAAKNGVDPTQSRLDAALAEADAAAKRYQQTRTLDAVGWERVDTGDSAAEAVANHTPADRAALAGIGKSLPQALRNLAGTLSGPREALALHLAGIVGDVPVTAETSDKFGTATFSDWRPTGVTLNPVGWQPATTLLHEAVHVATASAYERLAQQGHPLARALDQVLAQVTPAMVAARRASGNTRLTAAVENAHELLAYGMTSKDVQDMLRGIEISPALARQLAGRPVKMSLWEAFKGWIARVLNLPGSTHTALDGVLTAGSQLMEHGQRMRDDVELQASYEAQLRSYNAVAIPAPATSVSTAGILDDTAARPNGIAARLLASTRGSLQGIRKAALASSALDTIKEWMGDRMPGLQRYQDLVSQRSARISRLMDNERLTAYRGEAVTAKGLSDIWLDLARQDRERAKLFDKLLTASTEHQIHLDRPATAIKKDPSKPNARVRMWQRYQPEWQSLPQAWKDLYPAVRTYYQNTQQMLRDSLLNRLKADIEASTENDLTTLDFADLKAVKETELLTDKQKAAIRTIHATFSPLSFYAPLRRRGDYVVRASLDIDGVFSEREASDIKAMFPDRRLVMETQADGRVRLRIRSTPQPDETDPELRTATGFGTHGEPVPLYERFESRADAERRIAFLNEKAAQFAKRTDVDMKLTVRTLDRQRQDPAQITPDPIISRGSQRELMSRIDGMGLSEGERVRMRRLVSEVTAGMLPDTYAGKSRVRRRFIAGASQDQLRALGEHITAFSHNLAHMEHDRAIEDHLGAMDKEISDDTKYGVGTERENVRLTMREIRQREDIQLSRGLVSPWVNAVTGTTYFYMLTSASYSMIQFLQPFMVGLPLLGARYGTAKTMAHMARAVRMFSAQTIGAGGFRTVQLIKGSAGANVFDFEGILDRALTSQPDGDRLRQGLHYARDINALDLSFAREIHEARSLPSLHRGERNIPQQLSSYGQWAMDISRMLPHAVEVSNRAVTFTVAYRLEYEKTHNHDAAVEAGVDAIRKSQIDYSQANKPRLMQSKAFGGALRIPLMFKQYALHMYALFGLNAMRAVQGDRAERIQAAKALIGLLSTHALAAGAAGIMLEPIKIMIYAVSRMVGGDDDEPFDVDKWMHRGLRELFGESLGEAAFGGLPRLLGADISGRVGLQNLLLFNTLDDLDKGRSFYEVVGSLLTGPVGALAFKSIPDAFKAFAVGDTTKGVSLLLPKFAKDAVKAYGLHEQGILDTHGNRIDQSTEIGIGALAAQALGFRPTQVANLYEAREAIIDRREFLQNRTAQLLEQYWRSRSDSDQRRAVMAEIQEFNAANPQARISGDQLQRSMRERRRREQQTVQGVYLPRRDRYLLEEADYLR